MDFAKWDLIYCTRYPETVHCDNCHGYFNFEPKQDCTSCGTRRNVSNIITKVRPCILWIDQDRWVGGMSFAIPVSSSRFYSNDHNEQISLSQITYSTSNINLQRPIRAVIYQATRIDGGAFNTHDVLGKVTDRVVQERIETKLISWLFPSLVS
jgi:hypothetical protein